MGVVLVGGGVRSGKSRFALDYARKRFERLAFIATGQPLDAEMAERIRRHQAARGPRWTTIEEPLGIREVIEREAADFDIFVVDCLTLWLSNILLAQERDAEKEIVGLLSGLSDGPRTILVTDEVGCGIVPENALARRFRDLLGELNQETARIAEEVYWMVFGIPIRIKGVSPSGIPR